MRCESFNDVLVRNVLIESSGQLRSGIFNNDGVIEDSLLRRHYGVYIDARTDPLRGTVNTGPSGTVIFGGYLRSHFGHFLLETLSAVWALREYPHLPIVWIPLGDENQWVDWLFT